MSISTWKHYIVYYIMRSIKKQVLLTVCWKKESWIVAEYEKCGGGPQTHAVV